MEITVYACMAEEVEKKLNKLSRKAEKYGVPFTYERGEVFAKSVSEYSVSCGEEYVVRTYDVEAITYTVNAEAFVKLDGWTVLAMLEHFPEGNIVTTFGCEAEAAWYKLAGHCDHCNTKRNRASTFIVEKDGQRRQVGKTCLKDYTGIDPAVAALWAAVRDINIDERDWCNDIPAGSVLLDTRKVIAYAVDAIAKHGYVKSDETGSTRSSVREAVNFDDKISKETAEKAEKIAEWVEELCKDFAVIGIERDCLPLVKSGYCKHKHIGRLAYLPVAYDKAMARKAAEEAKPESNSTFVGNVGERITFDADTAKLVTSWENMYGYTYLYNIVDALGNVFVWYASRLYEELRDGVTITGTVKDHSEYRGTKQTVITRCRIS